MDKKAIDFLGRYINNPSPTGFERSGQKLWLEYVKSFVDTYYLDNYNNAIGIINPDVAFKIMLEAHGDEISWLVNYIDGKGFLHVIPNGGSDPEVCPGKRAMIHTQQGPIPCVFGWPPIHLRPSTDFRVDEDHLFLDCGCTSAEEVAKLGIRVGDVVTFSDPLGTINNKHFVGRGLDNRIGALIIAEVARQIKTCGKKLPFGLYIVNGAQEEAGLNAARMTTEQIQPDIAIVTDVTHDTSIPFIDKRKHGDTRCGKGPVLAIAPAIHKGLLQFVQDIAQEQHIPYQLVAISRETDTDAEAIALAQGGVCSVLISPPLRYMHTPAEMVCIADIDHTIQLITALVTAIDPKTINLNNHYQPTELS